MVQSPTFWCILFASAIIYWQLPKRVRAGFLATVSFGYLASLEPTAMSVVLFWTLLFYYLAPLATSRENRLRYKIVPALVLAILGYLAYYKYVPILIQTLAGDAVEANMIIPLGISYFTFKLVHYAVEAGRGNISSRSLTDFASYMFLFPIFTAGPIQRFDQFHADCDDHWKLQTTSEGITRIIHGLVKKFVIGQAILLPQFGYVTDAGILLENLERLPVFKVWGFLVLFFLYAYVDFSAYSDIAIGASRLFGLRIMENFNFPIVSQNIREFWKRWHMTLANWCQSYVYMPMIGLTRNPYVAIYCTFIAMGLWHAGSMNWVCWGLYHASGVSLFLTWTRFKQKCGWRNTGTGLLRFAGYPLTFLFVTVGYAFNTPHGHGGVYGSLRILAKLVTINLPA